MGARRQARECALQLLYQWEGSRDAGGGVPPDDSLETFWKNRPADNDVRVFAEELYRGALSRLEEIDTRIEMQSQHWKIDRMAAIDRCILRLGIYELLAARRDAPPAVVIDEALEISKKFSAAESAEFINGILDAVRKEIEINTAENP